MNLQELIKQWIVDGLSDAEISQKVFEHEGSKSFTPAQVAELVINAKQAQEVQQKLVEFQKAQKAKENESKAKTEVEAQVKKLVDEQLKSIQLNFGEYKQPKIAKRFDYNTGLYVELDKDEADEYKNFNQMLYLLARKDLQAVESISKEIDQDNQKKLESIGIKQTAVSDVDSRGAYSVPTTVDEMILQLSYTQSQLFSLTRKFIVNYNAHIVPTMGNFSVQWLTDQSTTITDDTPNFYNPTITMERMAIGASLSREFIEQKGTDLVSAFVQQMASTFAREIDLMIVSASITGNSDPFNGLVFDSNTSRPTAYALSALTDTKLLELRNLLSDEAQTTVRFIANRKVVAKIGQLENTAGYRIFPDFLSKGASGLSPFGVAVIEDPKIPSTFDVGTSKRTTGTDDVIICADLDKVGTMVSASTRIELSNENRFFQDMTVIKGIKKYGQKVLAGSGNLGVVAVAQELTN